MGTKAILEFDLEDIDSTTKFNRCVKSTKYCSALYELYEYFRKINNYKDYGMEVRIENIANKYFDPEDPKNGELCDSIGNLLEHICSKVFDTLNENEFNVND